MTAKSAKKRVLISGATLGLGGIRTHLLYLCAALREHRIEVSLFSNGSHWDEDSVHQVRQIGVEVTLPPRALRGASRLAGAYSAMTWPLKLPRNADSLYCIGAGRSHLLLNRLRPRGATSINHEIVEPPDRESLAGQCAELLDSSVANSKKVAERMRGFWPKKPIQVIPFLTSDRPTSSPTPRTPVGLREIRVVYLGRLVEQKRPDVLVRRWREISLQSGVAPARLDVYGYDPEGRMLSEIRSVVSSNGLENQVQIHGEYALKDLPAILKNSDLVVLPSLWEGLPLVLVEAMLHGVPFVATAAGGTEELGFDNPDVSVTSTDWPNFEEGLIRMIRRLRAGSIDAHRLHAWAEKRYGYESVSQRWINCLCEPKTFFNLA